MRGIELQINDFLHRMVEKEASDMILRVGLPPVNRIHGALVHELDLPALSPEDLQSIFEAITSPDQRAAFARDLELDFAYGIPGVARFRVNVMRQRGTLGFTFRQVPFKVPTVAELKLPEICKDIILKPRGLILVTGPTGSGKSTTVAAMIDYLNDTDGRNIITIEDPIEYLHRNKKCLIAQRDLGDDTRSFDAALIHALRQNPDVVFIGEMRDLTTIAIAIRAAETGHLVIGTLHTVDAAQTIDRIIDIFPSDQQQQIRLQLSQVIEAVLCQALVPLAAGHGRAAAFEIMIATSAVRNLIREGKVFQLPGIIQISSKDGMQTLNQALSDLVKKHIITKENALLKSSDPAGLGRMIGGPVGVM